MTDAIPPFEDPALKQAVRVCWGKVQAPGTFGQSLRGKLASSPDLSSPASYPIRGIETFGPQRTYFLPLAAAAAIVLVVGSIFWVVASNSGPHAFPETWASDLVARHDSCSSLADHHFVLGVAPNDIAGARSRLANQLGFPVLSMAADDGWQFRGAGPCPVGMGPSAHFLYRRGDTTLSVFSLHVPAVAGDTTGLESEVSGHQLAGFVRGDTLYCVVEYDPAHPISPSAAQSLIGQLQNNFAAPTASGDGAVAATTHNPVETTHIALDAPADPDDSPSRGVATAALR
jgi:hypothetical protein